jgi:hypothetical protein
MFSLLGLLPVWLFCWLCAARRRSRDTVTFAVRLEWDSPAKLEEDVLSPSFAHQLMSYCDEAPPHRGARLAMPASVRKQITAALDGALQTVAHSSSVLITECFILYPSEQRPLARRDDSKLSSARDALVLYVAARATFVCSKDGRRSWRAWAEKVQHAKAFSRALLDPAVNKQVSCELRDALCAHNLCDDVRTVNFGPPSKLRVRCTPPRCVLLLEQQLFYFSHEGARVHVTCAASHACRCLRLCHRAQDYERADWSAMHVAHQRAGRSQSPSASRHQAARSPQRLVAPAAGLGSRLSQLASTVIPRARGGAQLLPPTPISHWEELPDEQLQAAAAVHAVVSVLDAADQAARRAIDEPQLGASPTRKARLLHDRRLSVARAAAAGRAAPGGAPRDVEAAVSMSDVQTNNRK